jgi:hypothetical protein
MQRLAGVADNASMRRRTRRTVANHPLDTLIAQSAPAAFDSVRAEIAAVPAHALVPINLDVLPAARRGLVIAERIAPLLPELAKCPYLDLHAINGLHTYSLALIHAHALIDHAEAAALPISVLVTEAIRLRGNLMATAEMLSHFGFISPERVEAIRRGKGYANLADDLLALGLLLRSLWHRIKDRVLVAREDVDRAMVLSASLHKALGSRESNADPLVEPNDPRFVRAQAYTLFYRAYDECRRGVTCLRWHDGDARHIVPSLYSRRPPQSSGGSTARTAGVDVREDVPAPPAAPAAAAALMVA